MIKLIYKKPKRSIGPNQPIFNLLNELFSSLVDPFERLEKLMPTQEFEEFAKNITAPFDKSDNICSVM